MSEKNSESKIITFYSYKGGTGRSMALANVAWILASNGKRVLTVDWDLEAPGLHRYFKPFLTDRNLTSSEGIIDLVIDYAVEALTPPEVGKEPAKDWYVGSANILRYASSLNWEFPSPGRLDFISAGKQGPSYGTRMNSFDWRNFYERLGGRRFLEAIKKKMKEEYDYIFIDSRTGVSDTSGICTVEMPDLLVVCFTLNDQSIEGAAAVAASIREQRKVDELGIFPVPMRIEIAEKQKLDIRKDYAQAKFSEFPELITFTGRDQYWEDVQFSYVPYYAYEEILAAFGDKPRQKNTILASAERLASYLTKGEIDRVGFLAESKRLEGLSWYEESPLATSAREGSKNLRFEDDIDRAHQKYSPAYKYDLFLSHSQRDSSWVAKLANRLEEEMGLGHSLRTFLPQRDIRPGQSISRRIEEGIDESRKIAIVMSPESINEPQIINTSRLSVSSEKEGRVIPLYLRTCEIPDQLHGLSYIDFRDDSKFEESYKTLLAVIRNEPLPETTTLVDFLYTNSNIPSPPPTGFVIRRDRDGRDILHQLTEQLEPRKNQFIALWGAGGVGKTTLAAEAARAVADSFGNRVVWVSAESRQDFDLIDLLDEISTQLGQVDLRRLAPEPKKSRVREIVMAAPTLVVLDNFETIAPTEANQCLEWLAHPALCSTLITTRDHIEKANNIAIGAMLSEEAHDLLQRLIDKVRDPTAFSNLDRNRVIQTADANPLVLKWILSQIDLAQDAGEVLSELTHGEGSAAERVFDRSFELRQLNEGGRAVLLALSLFVPSATRKALAEVAGLAKGKDRKRFKEAVKTLSALWLLRSAEAGERLSVEGLTRELARARLHRDPRSRTFPPRYVLRFRSYAEAHQDVTPANLNAIEAERDNILNAIDIAAEMNDAFSVMRICSAIEQFLYLRGYWDEAVRRGEQALRTARNSGRELEIVRFAHAVAIIHQSRGELGQARDLYNESLKIGKTLGDDASIAATLHQLGELAQNEQRLEEARGLYGESLMIKKRLGNQYGIAMTLHQLGILAQDQREFDEARRLYSESFEIEKKLGDQGGIAITLQQLGILAQDQGELDEARQLYNESLTIHKRLGSQLGIANVLYRLGLLSHAAGNDEEAARSMRESVDILERLRSPVAETVKEALTRLSYG